MKSVICIFAAIIFSCHASSTVPESQEQIDSVKSKLDSLLKATNSLVSLALNITDAGFRDDVNRDFAAITKKMNEESKKIGSSYIPSHEQLSQFKTGFYGLRYKSCKKIYDELGVKRSEISTIRVATKRNFDSEMVAYLKLCDADAKFMGNQDISTNIADVLKNINDMIDSYKFLSKCVSEHCVRSN